MNFEDELKEIVNSVDGGLAGILMGIDGIAVAEFKKPELQLASQDLMVECGQVLSQAIKLFSGNELGMLEEMILGSREIRLAFRVLNANYFIGLFIRQDGNLGKGRYLLLKKSFDIQAQL